MISLFNSEKSLHVTNVYDITYVMRQSACLVFNSIMVYLITKLRSLIARRWVWRQTL